MKLPSVDFGLMHNHLEKHEAIIQELTMYYSYTSNTVTGRVIAEQIRVMKNHVVVMLQLINPEQEATQPLSTLQFPPVDTAKAKQEGLNKIILLNVRATAQTMAMSNFMSALEMHQPLVKQIHIHMALQQVQFMDYYSKLIRLIGAEQIPLASTEEQMKQLAHYGKVFQIKE